MRRSFNTDEWVSFGQTWHLYADGKGWYRWICATDTLTHCREELLKDMWAKEHCQIIATYPRVQSTKPRRSTLLFDEEARSDDFTTAQPGGGRVNFTGRRTLIDYSSKKMWEAALEHPTCSACGESITVEEDDQICNHCFKGGYCQSWKGLHICLLNSDIRPIYAQEVLDKSIKNNYIKAVRC